MNSRFYTPTAEHIAKLQKPWCASYSGGKNSTSLVTWIEWLRRTGQIKVDRPQLVQSDTTVEYPALQALSRGMMDLLKKCGWECAVVEPLIHEKLYNRILGIGNSPIHPGVTRMRWCTRSTKIDPMNRWRDANAGTEATTLTGLRIGESAMRDGKIKKRGCAAGGECGLPDLDERTWSPILRWTLCNVIAWLNGDYDLEKSVRETMADVFDLTRKLVEVYEVEIDRNVFDGFDPYVKSARFGCIGCPAIQAEREPPKSSIRRHGRDSPLNELYDVWFEARSSESRVVNLRVSRTKDRSKTPKPGPIRIEVRKRLFERVMDIQRRSGTTLITPEDEAFIRDCWKRKVYPRGWSEADESVAAPVEASVFDGAKP